MENPEVRGEGDGQRSREGRLSEIVHFEHGCLAAVLGEREQPAGDDADGEQRDDMPGAVSRCLAEDDREDDRAQGYRPEKEPGEVEAAGLGVGTLRDGG
jgi:hypothetical protein